jgi:hypothetical protein
VKMTNPDLTNFPAVYAVAWVRGKTSSRRSKFVKHENYLDPLWKLSKPVRFPIIIQQTKAEVISLCLSFVQ